MSEYKYIDFESVKEYAARFASIGATFIQIDGKLKEATHGVAMADGLIKMSVPFFNRENTDVQKDLETVFSKLNDLLDLAAMRKNADYLKEDYSGLPGLASFGLWCNFKNGVFEFESGRVFIGQDNPLDDVADAVGYGVKRGQRYGHNLETGQLIEILPAVLEVE
jgi:hypothetical protein